MIYKYNIQHLFLSFLRSNHKVFLYPINIWSSGVKSFFHKPGTMKVSDSEVELSKENHKSSMIKEGKLGKHVQITSDSYRDSTVSQAVVTDIYQLSSSIKGFTLRILNPEFTFLAGQWVDAFIPKVDFIGGFSICSSPSLLKEQIIIRLGIKNSPWPPAHWFYEKCSHGSEVSVRVGGDFYFPHEVDECSDLFLIAGGMGVNPIFSIFSHYCDLRAKNQSYIGKVSFLFSAKTRDELLYKSELDSLAKKYSEEIFIQYFTTKEDCNHSDGSRSIESRRMTTDDVSAGLCKLNKSRTKVYMCGPPLMIENMEKSLAECDIPKTSIYYEKWW